MSRITTTIRINRPIEEVFAYVTTPEHWLEWHPSSVSITGATDHPLHVSETVGEEFVVAGRHGRVEWTVIERDAPRRWVISGHVEHAGGGRIAYSLVAADHGTQFTRQFTYQMDNWILALLDRLLIRRRIDEESTKALDQLKSNLEAST